MNYDVIIIGGGVAGITSSIYAGCRGLNVLVVEQDERLGGTIGRVSKVSHFPGLMDAETGASYTQRMVAQAEAEGVHFLHGKVTEVELKGNPKKVVIDGKPYETKVVILATGGYPKPLGCENEAHFYGKGFSYCAVDDAPKYQDKEVLVVGGSDAALKECHYIASLAKKVYLVHALDQFQAIPAFQKKAKEMANIEILMNTKLVRVEGDDKIEKAILKNTKTDDETVLISKEGLGIFVYIGNAPYNQLFSNQLALENGYIPVDKKQATAIPGVFAAGDICVKAVRQVATAANDGAIAGINAKAYIDSL